MPFVLMKKRFLLADKSALLLVQCIFYVYCLANFYRIILMLVTVFLQTFKLISMLFS